jgi:hypothetical protein
MIYFSEEQKSCIVQGASQRQHMIETIKEVVHEAISTENNWDIYYKDAIISGTMGIGKTYNAVKELNEAGIFPVIIKGNQSIANLAGALMVYHYRFTHSPDYVPGQKLVVIFDDCDSLFESSSNLNILKSMTAKPGNPEDPRMFQHNVQINKHQYSDFQQSILEYYAPANGSVGIHVNCEDIIFLFTTNFVLPTETEAKNYMSKKGATPQARKKMDLAAIRRRVAPTPTFLLSKKVNWGWLAEVGLNDGGLDLLEDQTSKMILLDWMWNNWDHMTETNLSTMEKMAAIMKKNPTDYRDRWERAFINQMSLV